jgi:hypothetical protein
MNTDHSWEKACQEYIEVYNLIINKIWKLRRKMLYNYFRWWSRITIISIDRV